MKREEIIMMNENMENNVLELNEEMLEQVSGGKHVKALQRLVKDIENMRMDAG